LYDVGPNYLVMELVEGAALRGPMPMEDALSVARQIVEALEAAHEKGITHRDLKPANIKITPDGRVKVLDFGLAKVDSAMQADFENSPTLSLAATRAGAILGTAAYMSPEQARGVAVDKRADIWAFGAVLFEMLTGKPLFSGQTTTDILAAVVRAEPDFSALPTLTSVPIRRLLKRCLEKDPKKRLPDIGVARLEIDEALAAAHVEAVIPTSKRPAVLPWLVATFAVLALAVVTWFSLRGQPQIRWTGTRLDGPAVAFGPRISPDGQLLAFLSMEDGLTQVAVMKPDTGNWTVLTHDRTRGQVNSLCWSRDGSKLYFDRSRGIYSIPVLGGDEQLVVEDAANRRCYRMAAWWFNG
jgi:eukaryotic-like serine/threonine-protein kinase